MNQTTKWAISGAMVLAIMTPIALQPKMTASAIVWVYNGKASPLNGPSTIYSSPSKKKKLGSIPRQKPFKYIHKGAKWTTVKYKGKKGYVSTRELAFHKSRGSALQSAEIISKRFPRRIQELKIAEEAGDFKTIQRKIYSKINYSVNELKVELKRKGLTKAQIDQFTKKSLNPAEFEVNRMKELIRTWKDYDASREELNHFNIEKAFEKQAAANKRFDRAINKYPYHENLLTVMNNQQKEIERRFIYSTFNDLFYDIGDSEVVQLTGGEKDIFNNVHENGIISTTANTKWHGFTFENGRYIEKDNAQNQYKKVTFTMAAGEYWKGKTVEGEKLAEVFVVTGERSNTYTLDSFENPVTVSINLEEINLPKYNSGRFNVKLNRDVIISDIRFYR